MYKLEKQIIEMENFASHLEEVFITVEVRAGSVPPSDNAPRVAESAAVSGVNQGTCFLECMVLTQLLSPQPSVCLPVA